MIVVTGANGFIGANVVVALHDRGRGPILHVDDYPTIRGRGATETPPEAVRYERVPGGRYLDLHGLPTWLERHGQAERVAAIIHLGACSDTTVTDAAYVAARNTDYTRALFKWCAAARVPLVYASSAATYGDGSRGYSDAADPSIYQPLNLYGQSKHDLDLWALAQPPQACPPIWRGLKYFNVYGERESHKGRMASVAFHAFGQIGETGRVKLFQSHKEGVPHGGQTRDFIYVQDAVKITLHLLDTPASAAAPNGLYNAGTGTPRSFADLAAAVFRALGREPAIEFIPMPEDLRGKYQYYTRADPAKLDHSGYAGGFHTLEDGVAAYVRWLERHG